MKTEKNILVAFLLNLLFSLFELFGGLITNSISIISDAIHDFGDAISIGISCFLEIKSNKKPNNQYTFGYKRYSVLGALITNTILIMGSVLVIYSAIERIMNPIIINYNGMIVFALIGVIVNSLAVYFTKNGDSLNQKAVNLHMLEDVLGWIVVLIGAIAIKFTKINIIDSIMSILVSLFILFNALKSYKSIIDIFLEKTPKGIEIEEIKKFILNIKNIEDIHHIHVWSIDGINNYATMHIKTNTKDLSILKKEIKEKLKQYNINHTTIEFENNLDKCNEIECEMKEGFSHHHH